MKYEHFDPFKAALAERIEHMQSALHGIKAESELIRERVFRPEKHLVPKLNTLYDTLRTPNAWRYMADAAAKGTIATAVNSTVSVPVTLLKQPLIRLSQWPNAVSAHLVVRFFGIAPQNPGGASQEVQVPATAGNVTLFTGQGILVSAVVTTVGTTALTFTDGAGNIIGEVLASATLGQEISFGNAAFNTSLVAVKATTTPVVTVTFIPQPITPSLIECIFWDNASNPVPLGELASTVGGNSVYDHVIPTPFTDSQSSSSPVGLEPSGAEGPIVGLLQVTVPNVANASGTYNWSMSFSIAYLLPSSYAYELRSDVASPVAHGGNGHIIVEGNY